MLKLVSKAKLISRAAAFHTAAPRRAAQHGQAAKKLNIQHTEERLAAEDANKPSVILGTRPRDDLSLWPKCDLAKCLVNSHVLNGPPPSTIGEKFDVPDLGEFNVPKDTNYGVGPVEKQMLFGELPSLSAKMPLEARDSPFTSVFDSQLPQLTKDELTETAQKATAKEVAKMEIFSKVIDLRNANAKGIAYENRRRIILEFSGPKNPFDPGRAEVQAALLTYQIRNLWNHLTTSKRDVGNRRGLRKLIHQRAKILKYLKNKNKDRYEALLPRLALEPAGVEGELVV